MHLHHPLAHHQGAVCVGEGCANLPSKRYQMMLAQTIHLNILHNNQLIMILMKHRPIHNIPQILLIPLRKEHHRLRVPLGCPVQPFAVRVLADAFEDRAHGAGESLQSGLGFGGGCALVQAVEGAEGGPGEAVEVDCGVGCEGGLGAGGCGRGHGGFVAGVSGSEFEVEVFDVGVGYFVVLACGGRLRWIGMVGGYGVVSSV